MSRSPLLFLESEEKGQEWVAYRVVDGATPFVFDVDGPGRLLLALRIRPELDAAGVAAVLEDERIVLTVRVSPELDPRARVIDEKPSVPSKAKLHLLHVAEGRHRITVRHSEGAVLLVSPRFSPTSSDDWDEYAGNENEIPLAPIRSADQRTVQTVGTLRSGKESLLSEPPKDDPAPARPARSKFRGGSAPPRRSGPPEPSVPTGPSLDPQVEAVRRPAGAPAVARRLLTVRAPSFQYEIRAGMYLSRFGLAPSPTIGMDARIPLASLDSRAWTVGLSVDGSYGSGESTVGSSGAPVDVAEVRYGAVDATVNVRRSFGLIDEVVDPYVTLGVGGTLGRISVETGARYESALTKGLLGSAAFGVALGGYGDRLFFELKLATGLISSALTRAAPDSEMAGYFSTSALLGYRFEWFEDVPLRGE